MRKATNAIQLSGALMVKVPNGGRKKKLKQTTPSKEANTAGPEPHRVATKRITSRKASATVVGLMRSPRSFKTPVPAAIPTRAAQYPNQTLRKSLGNTRYPFLSIWDNGSQSDLVLAAESISQIIDDSRQELSKMSGVRE